MTVTTTATTTGLPELNTELIRLLVGWAEQDEAWRDRLGYLGFTTWDQGTWGYTPNEDLDTSGILADYVKDANVCGTAHCQAGGAIVYSDQWRLIYEEDGSAEYCRRIEWTGAKDEKGRKVYRDVDDKDEYISTAAMGLLGFTDGEAESYFSGSNTIDDLKCYANGFAADRDMPPIFFRENGKPYSFTG